MDYVTVNKEKMAKSEGNFVTINELKSRFDGQVVRLAMLSTHYTQPFDWNDRILETSYKNQKMKCFLNLNMLINLFC